MSLHSRRSSVISPGSVALADILANSVAVILILILATLVNRQEQAREELERNTDITTILARQLATSIVFNDLPSSPPSVLHDYISCNIPHDCDPMLFPVLELHQGYLRIFNTNTRIYRAELLRQHNAFDRYIAALPLPMRQGIRLDIHSVSEYYLVIGIMQEHGLWPRHWHYLGEHVPPLANDALAERVEGAGNPEQTSTPAVEDGQGNNRDGTASGVGEFDDSSPGLEGTRLGGAGILGNLNYDSLLPPTAMAGRSGSGSAPGDPFAPRQDRRGNSMLNRQGQPGPLGTSGQTMRLFVPNATPLAQQGQSQIIRVPPEHYVSLVLSYLFKMLEAAREYQAFEPARQNQWLLRLAEDPQLIADLPHYDLVQQLAAALQAGTVSTASALQAIRPAPEHTYNRLLIQPNVLEGALSLHLGQPTAWLAPLHDAEQVQPQFLLRPHPSLFKGEMLDMPSEYALLMLPDEVEFTDPDWRPVAVIDRQLQNVALGFVYAGIEREQPAIHAGINQLRLNRRPTANPRLNTEDRMQNLTPVLWILAVLGLLLLFRFAPRRARI
ncbi:MAG: hypothetical protein ACR2P9_09245 [Gammaproteobacteria bacterium]